MRTATQEVIALLIRVVASPFENAFDEGDASEEYYVLGPHPEKNQDGFADVEDENMEKELKPLVDRSRELCAGD